jgi:hypothetical protein
MVARQNRSVSSSKEGALLIDELTGWIDRETNSDPALAEARNGHPDPDRVPAQVALGFFLLQENAELVEFEPEKLLREGGGSLGWDLALAEAHGPNEVALSGPGPARDPDYRFAVVQSQLYRVHLRSAVRSFDALPLARYLSHFARWHRERERAPEVCGVVGPVLEWGRRGLGLEGPG